MMEEKELDEEALQAEEEEHHDEGPSALHLHLYLAWIVSFAKRQEEEEEVELTVTEIQFHSMAVLSLQMELLVSPDQVLHSRKTLGTNLVWVALEEAEEAVRNETQIVPSTHLD